MLTMASTSNKLKRGKISDFSLKLADGRREASMSRALSLVTMRHPYVSE
jgi:hypothetical protein